MNRTYKVGEHYFSLKADLQSVIDLFEEMENYKPFISKNAGNMSFVFELEVMTGNTIDEMIKETLQLAEFDDDVAYISVMAYAGKDIFLIALDKKHILQGGVLKVDRETKTAVLYLTNDSDLYHQRFILNNALMLLYAMFTSTLGTLLIHASVIVNNGKGYAFLGKSGTGKSTHSRLWLKNIEGSVLLNDDNPIIRVHSDGSIIIYGSPWSGKTPCYKNEGAELKSIVRLSQAPYNKIVRLNGVFAYAAISPSASSMKWNKNMTDSLHETFSKLIENVGIYHLECLPNDEASIMCFKEIE